MCIAVLLQLVVNPFEWSRLHLGAMRWPDVFSDFAATETPQVKPAEPPQPMAAAAVQITVQAGDAILDSVRTIVQDMLGQQVCRNVFNVPI